MNHRINPKLLFCSLVLAVVLLQGSFTNSAEAAPKITYQYDKTFKLKNKKFLFSNIPNEDQKIHKVMKDGAGGVIIIGSFTGYAGVARSRILRLNPNLTLDTGFAPAVNGEILDAALSADGKLFIGGDFTSVDGIPRKGIARLLATGSVDVDFDPLTGANGSFNNVTKVMPFGDGSVALCGNFSRVSDRLTLFSIAKITSTGGLDNGFLDNLHTATLTDGSRNIFPEVCEQLTGDKILVLGFGSDSSSASPDGFEGSTVINTDGTRTERIKDAGELLTSYKHDRGNTVRNGIAYGYISHELFNNAFKPISETLYRFDGSGAIDPAFKVKKRTYFNSVSQNTNGELLIAPQTIQIRKNSKGKVTYSAKPIIERYNGDGGLVATMNLPKIDKKAFEYRNTLELSDGSVLVHVRTVTLSSKASTGRVFTHYLVKVKRKKKS